MPDYLTATEMSDELLRRVRELAPEWAATHADLGERLLEALEAEPGELLVAITYDEFLVKFAGIHAEWVDGKVLLMTPVSIKHQLITQFLVKLLDEFAAARELGMVLSAPFQMRLSALQRGREPDVMFVASSQLGRIRPNYLDGAADLVVEVVSPESIGRDRGEKYQEYALAGVGEYWLIDPQLEQAEFYQLQTDGRYRLVQADLDGWYASPALPGLRLDVHWLWQDPPPSVLVVLRILGILG
jgi:Uma2 family endonuclease